MITIKIGGSVVDNLHPTTISDIKKIVEQEGVVLVHGGGKEVTKVSKELGKEPKFVVSPGGIKSRYTDKETAEIFTIVLFILPDITIVKISAVSLSVYLLFIPPGDTTNFGSFPSSLETFVTSFPPP